MSVSGKPYGCVGKKKIPEWEGGKRGECKDEYDQNIYIYQIVKE